MLVLNKRRLLRISNRQEDEEEGISGTAKSKLE
jgi:hypothetical protein